LHRYHWFVKGMHFFQLHTVFEDMYKKFGKDMGEVAERVLMMQGKPLATMSKYLEESTLVEASADDTEEEMIEQLLEDYNQLVSEIKEQGIPLAEENKDEPTLDLLIGLQQDYEKYIWMLSAYQNQDKLSANKMLAFLSILFSYLLGVARMKQTVIAIVGPTAVGKTQLSINLAKKFDGEIISGDSMQVYRGMDIGTAKIKPEEKQGIPHYMIDIRDPNESFTVADFQSLVQSYIKKITDRKKTPIIVGGSGLYIQAALYDYNFAKQERNREVVDKLEEELERFGITPLSQRLTEIDPRQASKFHPNSHRRVIRGLEIYEIIGLTMSEYQDSQRKDSPYDLIFIGLEMERKVLYERINTRVDEMIEDGLLNEVESLLNQNLESSQSMQAIGYKEFIPYYKGEYDLERAIELLKRNSRRYAKSQYTWFKNKINVTWYYISSQLFNKDFQMIFENLAGILKNR